MVVCGRQFSSDMISRIQTTVNGDALLSRRKLSRQVCEWLDWRSPNGRLQEMSCRKALAELNRRKVLVLPDRSGAYGFERAGEGRLDIEIPEVSCSLTELGEVNVSPITSRYCRDSKIARALLKRYHYLGSGSLRGAQMRYVVTSARWGHLGVLTFSSGTWALGDRDKYIGWCENARRANLQQVVCNDRFLILPTVHVQNLASHVLALTLLRLPEDWQQRYAVRPVLAETFVDPSRFEGTCYKAANWNKVGQTAGRRDGVAKTIFLHELSSHWRECLCAEPARPPLGRASYPELPPTWAHEEFGRVRFYDGRLKQRLYTIAQDFYGCPQGSIPEACGAKSRTMGAYRFFQNTKVTMDVLLTAHAEATIERISQHPIVLAPQDTTTLIYTTHPMTEGLGPIGSKTDRAIGLLLHDTMAFSEEGTPLGVLDAQCWARDPKDRGKRERRKNLPIEQKESRKWLRSFRKVAEVQKACPNTKLISIGDRESDIYELFLEARRDPAGPGLLVRMNRSARRKVGGIPLWDFMAGRQVDGTLSLHVLRSGECKARDTTLDVRFAQLELKPPKRLKGSESIPACAVYVREQSQHVIGNDPIEWMLMTTVETATFQHAQQRVQWYAKRWGIEVYHRTLKSGCRIQDRQLGSAHGLSACLGVDMVVAWRVYHLAMLGRETPDLPCTVFFTDDEWKALCCYATKNKVPPQEPPTLGQAMRMVGIIGGHLGRNSDGHPGTEVLWRGLQRLDTAVEMYVIFTSGPAPPSFKSRP
ncbi:MAG: IS4 family transposase [Acidobacteria bacterium]|nr:MAG: IS4 family transposase [Acidobacteriota bacterium]